MAQNSAGICLGYGTAFASATKIPGITSIPDIGGEPEALETTTLDNLKYTSYIPGLQDLGGNFGFEANFTKELRTAVNTAITAQKATDDDALTWYLYFPKPLDMYYEWKGHLSSLPVTGVGVNEVVKTTVYVSVENLTEHAGPSTQASWTKDTDEDGMLEGAGEGSAPQG